MMRRGAYDLRYYYFKRGSGVTPPIIIIYYERVIDYKRRDS